MSVPVFIDTLCWTALIHPADQWRAEAVEAYRALGSTPLVTTHEVLVETLNGMSGWGAYFRQKSVEAVRSLHLRKRIRLVEQSPETFEAGLRLYEQRPDKGYSLTDCISMSTMRSHGITRVLTSDHHFTQEGFEILIRRETI